MVIKFIFLFSKVEPSFTFSAKFFCFILTPPHILWSYQACLLLTSCSFHWSHFYFFWYSFDFHMFCNLILFFHILLVCLWIALCLCYFFGFSICEIYFGVMLLPLCLCLLQACLLFTNKRAWLRAAVYYNFIYNKSTVIGIFITNLKIFGGCCLTCLLKRVIIDSFVVIVL